MTPSEFKQRFHRSQSEPQKFCPLPSEKVDALSIAEADKTILREVGFPEEAGPEFEFRFSDEVVLEKPRTVEPWLVGRFDEFRLFGYNGMGEFITIHDASGRVVYHDHDNDMVAVLINSSIRQLAECLCLYSEAMQPQDFDRLYAKIAEIDPPAMVEGTMWWYEIEMLKDWKTTHSDQV